MSVISAKTRMAGVAGSPVRHSLSPLLHNAWLKEAGIDGVYVAFSPPQDHFPAFAEGLRGGAIVGLNVTIPFKQQALAAADIHSDLARAAGAANLLLFHEDGQIEARNTDGEGLMQALASQAPQYDPKSGPALVLGAGGAARGAVAALLEAGAPQVIVVNRTLDRAEHLAQMFGSRVRAFDRPDWAAPDAAVVVNATSLGLGGGPGPYMPWESLSDGCVAMDMVYKPLRTEFLAGAEERGLTVVDGLEMLIRQAIPAFEAFYGQVPPPQIDERRLLLDALEAGG
jgi:shikimate dehydrogenase